MPISRHVVEDQVPAGPQFRDYSHPDKKKKIKNASHPLGSHPAVPPPVAKEAFNSAYQEMMRKLERYTGLNLNNVREVMTLPQIMMEILGRVVEIEKEHKEELEDLAVSVVLRLPQFKGADKAIEAGHLKLKAELTPEEIDLSGAQTQDAQDQADELRPEEPAEITAELDELVGRRKFINHLIQGGATSSAYAFHLAEDELSGIAPHLLDDYGALMALAEFGHWATGDEQVIAALQDEQAKGGMSEIKQDEDGVTLIISRAKTFPMLIHEIVKGLLEYLSYSDEEDSDTVKRVHELADVIDDEPWHLMLGPELWKRLIIGLDKQEHFPKVYNKIIRMPTGEFNTLMKGLMAKSPDAVKKLKSLAT